MFWWAFLDVQVVCDGDVAERSSRRRMGGYEQKEFLNNYISFDELSQVNLGIMARMS